MSKVYYGVEPYTGKILKHFGIEGMQWGKRRWQYPDGRFNEEGKERYFGSDSKYNSNNQPPVQNNQVKNKDYYAKNFGAYNTDKQDYASGLIIDENLRGGDFYKYLNKIEDVAKAFEKHYVDYERKNGITDQQYATLKKDFKKTLDMLSKNNKQYKELAPYVKTMFDKTIKDAEEYDYTNSRVYTLSTAIRYAINKLDFGQEEL